MRHFPSQNGLFIQTVRYATNVGHCVFCRCVYAQNFLEEGYTSVRIRHMTLILECRQGLEETRTFPEARRDRLPAARLVRTSRNPSYPVKSKIPVDLLWTSFHSHGNQSELRTYLAGKTRVLKRDHANARAWKCLSLSPSHDGMLRVWNQLNVRQPAETQSECWARQEQGCAEIEVVATATQQCFSVQGHLQPSHHWKDLSLICCRLSVMVCRVSSQEKSQSSINLGRRSWLCNTSTSCFVPVTVSMQTIRVPFDLLVKEYCGSCQSESSISKLQGSMNSPHSRLIAWKFEPCANFSLTKLSCFRRWDRRWLAERRICIVSDFSAASYLSHASHLWPVLLQQHRLSSSIYNKSFIPSNCLPKHLY